MLRKLPSWSLLPFVAATLLMVHRAHADMPDHDRAIPAQALFADARALMEEKEDFKSACPKLEEATTLLPEGFGAALTLGDCYAKAARLASAWASYSIAESIALRAGQIPLSIKAHQKAEALRAQLATLTLVVPEAARAIPGLEVWRDGVPAGVAQWGMPIPVDRGDHHIVVEAPGRGRWEKTVAVPADNISIEVMIEAPHALAPPPAPLLSVAPPAAEPLVARASPPRERPRDAGPASEPASAWRSIGIVTAGVGLVGLGVGAAYGVKASLKKNESYASGCPSSNRCDAAVERLWGEARAAGTIATVLLISGGAVATTGLILWKTAPKARDAGPASVAVGPSGVIFSGQW